MAPGEQKGGAAGYNICRGAKGPLAAEERRQNMAMQCELAALAEAAKPFVALVGQLDGERREFVRGVAHAFQDAAGLPRGRSKLFDKWSVNEWHSSPDPGVKAYAEGYREGQACAKALLNDLRGVKPRFFGGARAESAALPLG